MAAIDVIAEINSANDERERAARSRARQLINSILENQNQIVELQAEIAKSREELSKLNYTPVTAADVLGQ